MGNRQEPESHGATRVGRKELLYIVWTAFKGRCYTPSHAQYKNYGARGIVVCKEWMNSYAPFRAWAKANGYQKGLMLDRIDNNGHYCPANCRWVTTKESNRNKQRTIWVTIGNQTKCLGEWAEMSGIGYTTLLWRYHKKWHPEYLLMRCRPMRRRPHVVQ